ncbi:ribonuclease H-like domain-containing protein [bacterium]|nr:ribonuclease H-like domain-containing protein [bacterium]
MNTNEALHGAYVARQCPVRVFRDRDPFESARPAEPDPALQALFDEGSEFETRVVDMLADIHGDDLVRIATRDADSPRARVEATSTAMQQGAGFIGGALLEHDIAGRRLSEVDLLMRLPDDNVDPSTPKYWPIDIKHHRATKRLDKPAQADQTKMVVNLDLSSSNGGFIPKRLEGDCVQLAHYYRHLQALGYAEPSGDADPIWAGIIDSRMLLVWFDLNAPAHATITPQVIDDTMEFHTRSGKNSRSALERYDFEFAFRLDIADNADARTAATEKRPVLPVKIKECERCPWQEPCDTELRDRDDVSLVAGVNYPEWKLHRHMGNPTTQQLAGLDTETAQAMAVHGKKLIDAHAWAQTVPPDTPSSGVINDDVAAEFPTAGQLQHLCEQTLAYHHTPINPAALCRQIENARSVQASGPIIRQHVEIPRGDIEIDFDLECTVNPAQVYLWGALVTHNVADWPEPSGTYTSFANWEPMTEESEAQLVADLWGWLQQQIARAEQQQLTIKIYGYNLATTETSHLRRITATGAAPGLPSADELTEFTDHDRYVDLLPCMKRKWISNDGHGLKVMAPAHGFNWSDDDPSGLNSINWYNEAVYGSSHELIQRILDYNHDDCRATLALRQT